MAGYQDSSQPEFRPEKFAQPSVCCPGFFGRPLAGNVDQVLRREVTIVIS